MIEGRIPLRGQNRRVGFGVITNDVQLNLGPITDLVQLQILALSLGHGGLSLAPIALASGFGSLYKCSLLCNQSILLSAATPPNSIHHSPAPSRAMAPAG